MARPFHALDEMGYIIGSFDGLLPYGKEIDRCATEGGMFRALNYCNPKYTLALNKVLDMLDQEPTGQEAGEFIPAGQAKDDKEAATHEQFE